MPGAQQEEEVCGIEAKEAICARRRQKQCHGTTKTEDEKPRTHGCRLFRGTAIFSYLKIDLRIRVL